MKQHKPHRIFIIGCPRSGTTLTQTLVSSNRAVYSSKETHYYFWGFIFLPFVGFFPRKKLLQVAREFLEMNDIGSAEVRRGMLAELASSRGLLNKSRWFFDVMDKQAGEKGKTAWVEKTPEHVWYVPLIQQTAKGVKFIHVIRSPRETVHSWLDAARKRHRHYPSLALYFYWWLSLRQSLRYVGRPNHYFLFYEDLVKEPEEQLEQLFHWLTLPPEPKLLTRRKIVYNSITGNVLWMRNVTKEIKPHPSHPHDVPLLASIFIRLSKLYPTAYRQHSVKHH